MKYEPSDPRPYRRRGKPQAGRWEVDIRGTLDNGLKIERERRVFPASPNAGKIGKRQAAAMALEEFERWNRHGQVLRPGETPVLRRTGAMGPSSAPTVEQFASDYLDFCRSPNAGRNGANSWSTLLLKEAGLRLHVIPAFGSLRLDQITRRDVDQYVMTKSKDRSLSALRSDINYLQQMIKLAKEHDLITNAPTLKLPPDRPRQIEALAPDEIPRFIAAAQQRSHRDQTLLELYLRAGLRLGEAVALHPCDFDLDAAQPTVKVSQTFSKHRLGATKGRKTRIVPLVPSLAKKVDELLRQRGLSPKSTTEFPFSSERSTKKPLGSTRVSTVVQAVGEAAEIEGLHPHMLRHTFGTECARRAVPVLTIKEWMGHADIDVTMRYLHLVTPDHLRWAQLLTD